MVPKRFFPIYFIAIKNSHKLWVRTMLLWLQAEAVGREKPLAVLVFHAPWAVSGSFLHLQGSAKDSIIKLVKLWSQWVWLHWGSEENFLASDSHFPSNTKEPWEHAVHPTPPTSCQKKTPVRRQQWSHSVPVLWPAAHHRTHWPHRDIQATRDILTALGILILTQKLSVWYKSKTSTLHHPLTY